MADDQIKQGLEKRIQLVHMSSSKGGDMASEIKLQELDAKIDRSYEAL